VVTGEEAQRHRAEIAEARPGWYWWVIMIVTVAFFSSGSILISAMNQRHSEQALCEVIVLSDDIYRAHPPITITGRQVAAAMARLRQKYHCPAG
jgi:hypothetical protein